MYNPFAAAISSLLPEPQAGLLNGILFGIRADLPREFYQALIATGTVHIIALSGMNISILIGLISGLTGFLGRRFSALVTMVSIVGFVLFVGPAPPIVRAAIMGSLVMLAGYLGRQYWALFSLFFTSAVMLLVSPGLIWDVSFQLSFLATLGVLLAQRKVLTHPVPLFDKERGLFSRFLWLLFDGIKENFRLTIYAQVCTAPVLIFTFERFSLIAPVANVLIAWTIQPIMMLGLLAGFLGWIWYPLGLLPAWLVWVPLTYIVWLVEWLAKFPLASISW